MNPEQSGSFPDKSVFLLLAKLGLSIGLLAWLASRFHDEFTWPELQPNGIAIMSLCFAVGVLQIAILSLRWQMTTHVLAEGLRERLTTKVPFSVFFRLTWLGHAVSQVLPAVIAGDGLRIAGLKLTRLPLLFTTQSVLIDRIIGFLGLALLVGPGIIAAGKSADFATVQLLILVVAGGLACCALLLKTGILGKALKSLQGFEVLASAMARPIGLWLLFQSVIGHALSVAIFWLLCLAFGLNISLALCFLTFPLALMLTILPFSFGGWGVRELAVVHALGEFGIGSTTALQASLIFGTFQLLLSLPAAALLIGMGAASHSGRN